MRRAVESWVLSWLYFALLMGELCVVGNSDRNQDVLEFETCERF